MSEQETEQLDLLGSKHNIITNAEYRIVKESNDFYRVRHNMTLNQQRLVLFAASETQFRRDVATKTDDPEDITLYIPDLVKALGVSSKSAYNDFYTAGKNLGKVAFERRLAPGEYEVISLIDKARISKGRGLVQIKFGKSAMDFFGDISDHYHRFQLRQIACLSTTYQINLYRALSSVENTPHKTRMFWLYSEYLEKPTDMLLPDIMGYNPESTKSYQQFKNVNRRILKPAVEAIGQHTDITSIEIEEIRSGRKVVGVKLSYRIDYSRRSSLRAASQAWMHPLEFHFSVSHYKELSPAHQKEYDRKGFEAESIRDIFHTFVEQEESHVRYEVLDKGHVYPDISTIGWYMDWLEEKGHLKPEVDGDSWIDQILMEEGRGLAPEQSLVAVRYASQFSTAKTLPLPECFELDNALYLWASNFYPWVDEEKETTRFILHAREKQLTSKNWVYAWMKWLAGSSQNNHK
ncbi:replication initiation protein [Parendozoicomonas sp. Alg238-R29]|uniref:replication initiation protein n=1 Tax=Parendozoicomonas sp. Alg238-R29 TaxID=2993446 RepID=UPI00248E7EE7|nr:replication initiation protein [Parendozoicomonas sp. Alg238-R29]